MAEVIDNIYVQNDFFIPYEPYSEDPADLRRLTKIFTSSDLLERADIAITTILAALVQHTKPQAAQSTLTVPLYDLVPLPDFITFIQQQIFAEEVAFPIVAERLLHNAARASDIDPLNMSGKKLKTAHDFDTPSRQLAFLTGTKFPELLSVPLPFVIPRTTWAEHGALFAKSGHGKTQTLRAVVATFLQEPDPPALFIIDSLGSLIEGMADLEIFSTRLKDRLVILDPSDPDNIPSLNFFQLQSDDLCFYLFKAIDQSFTQRQATMIAYLMEYMRNIPGAGLLTLITVCESKENPYPDVVATEERAPPGATHLRRSQGVHG
jgi:hypothetical protein